MSKQVVALLAAIVVAASFAACGGSGSDTGSSATTTGQSGSRGEAGSSRSGSQKGGTKGQGKSGGEGTSAEHAPANGSGSPVVPLKVSGGGSDQYRVKGGDNSVQEFGEESGESELQEAAEALHSFYVARAEEDWPRACSYLSQAVTKQLEELAARSPRLSGKGCGAVLKALTRPLPAAVEREITEVDAGSLRREGDRAFLIYTGAGKTIYAITMQQEGGAWKVGLLAATPLN